MKKALVGTFVLALAIGVGATPASAFAARTSSASAAGLQANLLGGELIPFTPVVNASQPPDTPIEGNRAAIVPLDLGNLAVNGTGFVRADAHRADNIAPLLVEPGDNERVTLGGVNARGYVSIENADAVISGPIPGLPLLPELNLGSLVGADAIEAEAVAKCVTEGTGRRPPSHAEFDTGWNIAGLELADGELVAVEGLVDTLVRSLGADAATAPVLSIDTPGTDPSMIVRTADSVTITALRVRVLSVLGEPAAEINYGRATARMPTPCRPPECEDLVDNDGDGKIDFGPDPGCESREDDNEDDVVARTGGPTLAATGGDNGSALPMMAFGVLGAAVILRRTAMRSYRKAS